MAKHSIKLDELTVHADGKVILGPLSVELTEPRIALLGANGSGKSTLLRTLCTLTVPTGGSASVHAVDVREKPRQIRESTALALSDPNAQLLLPTIGEDLALSLKVATRRRSRSMQSKTFHDPEHTPRLQRPRWRTRLAAGTRTASALDGSVGPRTDPGPEPQEILDALGIPLDASRAISTLSGGQRQLVALASVIATSPQLLLCDEPTTSLDVGWRREITRFLMGLADTLDRPAVPFGPRNIQVVVATHDLELAAQCDRALVLHEGQLVCDAAPNKAIAYYQQLTAGTASTLWA